MRLKYNVGMTGDLGFLTINQTKIEGGNRSCSIAFRVLKFVIYITGDLVYYTDVLGKPSSSGYWCHLCTKSWKRWNENTNADPYKSWTLELMISTLMGVVRDKGVKGVKILMHYRTISPILYVIPLLHVEIGLVNKLWNEFTGWIENNVKNIESDEMQVQNLAQIAKPVLDVATELRRVQNTYLYT